MKNKKDFNSDYSLSSLGIQLSVDQDQLLNRFFKTYYEKDMDLNQAMALDLYRAINCYRYYRNVDMFIELNPEATEHREEIESLWLEFHKLSDNELAEIALKALEEI